MRMFAVLLVLPLACVHRLERTVTPQLATVDHKAAGATVGEVMLDRYALRRRRRLPLRVTVLPRHLRRGDRFRCRRAGKLARASVLTGLPRSAVVTDHRP